MNKKYFFILTLILIILLTILVLKLQVQIQDQYYSQLDFSFENYKNKNVPIFEYKNNINELKMVLVDNIEQVFYTKNDSTEYYSYLIVNENKYDIGYIGFLNLENSNYVLSKTQLFKNNNPIYKYYISEGANYINSIYFQIINNKPVILTEIPNGFEFRNNKEIMTYNSFGIPSVSNIYIFNDKGINICNLNAFLEAEHVQFEPNSKEISVLKKVDFQNPENNKLKKFKLKGKDIYITKK